MRAVVTGATGFIGSRLCRMLDAAGHHVRAVVREGTTPPPLIGDVVRVRTLDANTEWEPILGTIDTVFHVAGAAHVTRSGARKIETARAINVDATARLARSARGIRRFIYVSTAKVHGQSSGERPFRESDPPAPPDAYARMKLEAEDVLRSTLPSGVLTIFRPALVYGPGVRANFLSLLRAADRELPLPLGSIDNRRSLIFVENLTCALLWGAETEAASGRTFLVSDGEDVSTPELIRRIARALGRRCRLFPLNSTLIRGAATISGRRAAFDKIAGSFQVDINAITLLGWRPPITMESGLAATAAWYQQRIDGYRS